MPFRHAGQADRRDGQLVVKRYGYDSFRLFDIGLVSIVSLISGPARVEIEAVAGSIVEELQIGV